MEKQKEIIKKLGFIKNNLANESNSLGQRTLEEAIQYLSKLNPNRIDEERMEEIHKSFFIGGYDKSYTRKCVSKYNSTIEDHQVLQPLPSVEKLTSELLGLNIVNNDSSLNEISKTTAKYLHSKYGTPTKKELVSVEELKNKMHRLVGSVDLDECEILAQHIIDTYSLNPPKREWWIDLKEGDKFKNEKGNVFIFDSMFYIGSDGVYSHPVNKCQPYIEPSIHDKVKEKLGIELYQEFMKEVMG